MPVRYDDNLAQYVRRLMDEKGIKSSRQAEIKTGVSYGTIQNMLHGRAPKVDLFLQFLRSFGDDIDFGAALRECGYTEMADAVQGRQSDPSDPADHGDIDPPPLDPEELTYEPLDEEEGQVLRFYHGINPILRPKALAVLKALMDEDPDYEEGRAFGKKVE